MSHFIKTKSFLFSIALTIASIVIVSSYSQYKNDDFNNAQALVAHTNEVITSTLSLNKNVAELISNQRAYLINSDMLFKDHYDELKLQIIEKMEYLLLHTADNPFQTERFNALKDNAFLLFEKLEDDIADSTVTLKDAADVAVIEKNIESIAQDILDEEHRLLDIRLLSLKKIQDTLILGIIFGIFATAVLIVGLNYYLYKSKMYQREANSNFIATQERLNYAMSASGEGIYDWDIKTNKIMYSPSYVEMLGYDVQSFDATVESTTEKMHPDDYEEIWGQVQTFLNNDLSEYNAEFRLRHKNGHYIWVQSKATLVRDADHRALRMIGVHRDISHFKQKEKILAEEAGTYEKYAHAKSGFLAHMSHEIRTPLTAITGIAEILEKNMDSFNQRQKELVKTLSTSAKSLRELINDILDFTKIENGDIDFEDAFFPLRNLTSEITSIMSVQANEKNITFKVIDDDIQSIEYYGDHARIRQILLNLVGNAIKFTNEGLVTLLVTKDVVKEIEYLSFTVQDTGIGIKASMLDTVFEEFQQGDSSISRQYGGTGLGLPISKNLAHLMGGDISVVSTENLGSTFTLKLPLLDRAQAYDRPVSPELKQKITDKLSSAIRDEQCALVVEDYEGNIVVLSYLMEEIGMPYNVAKNGEQAISMWREKHYDIVLMDIQMPVMDGLTATREIRKIEDQNGFAPTPIIGMTAHALMQDKDKCIESGMTDYLSKPIDSNLLKQKILKHIQKDNVVSLKRKTTSS